MFSLTRRQRNGHNSKAVNHGGLKKTRSLSFEALEARRMLAVGSFERLNGLITSGAVASAGVSTLGDTDGGAQKFSDEVLTKSQATASASDENGAAFAFGDGIAHIPVPIGAYMAAPYVTSKAELEFNATGVASVFITTPDEFPFAGAGAYFQYNADPNYSGDLELHIHLYITFTGGIVHSGNYVDETLLKTHASIDQNTYIESDGGGVSGQLPDIGSFVIPGVTNFHVTFTVPAGDVSLNSWVGPDIDGGGGGYVTDGSLAGIIGLTAAAWAYMTPVGQDTPQGDFNSDGIVNVSDYDLWKTGDPRADGDLDGDVDNDDFDLWANNASDVIIVTSGADSGTGSLRAAINTAATNPGTDTIVFDPSVHNITLSSHLDLESDVVVDGPGTDDLVISGNDVDRVMYMEGATVSLSDLTLSSGNVEGNGGGIGSLDCDVTLNRVTVSNNYVDGGSGGGIYVENGSLSMSDSTVDGNSAGDGIDAIDADLSIISSTISNNGGGYGGIYFWGNSNTLLIANSTISGNGGFYAGGLRIQNLEGTSNIINCTITDNTCLSGTGTGGILINGSDTSVTIHNTIIAGNRRTNNADADLLLTGSGSFDSQSSHNLIGYDPNALFPTGNSNQNGGTSVLNAHLTALADYGGPTKTHALLEDSDAIDAGDNDIADSFGLLNDQRGLGYDRQVDWGLGGNVDIGAFELAIDEIYPA